MFEERAGHKFAVDGALSPLLYTAFVRYCFIDDDQLMVSFCSLMMILLFFYTVLMFYGIQVMNAAVVVRLCFIDVSISLFLASVSVSSRAMVLHWLWSILST